MIFNFLILPSKFAVSICCLIILECDIINNELEEFSNFQIYDVVVVRLDEFLEI